MRLRAHNYCRSYNIMSTLMSTVASKPAESKMRIAVLHAGACAPGMNAAVRAVVRIGLDRGFSMVGICGGISGLQKWDAFDVCQCCTVVGSGLWAVGCCACAEHSVWYARSYRGWMSTVGSKWAVPLLESTDIRHVKWISRRLLPRSLIIALEYVAGCAATLSACKYADNQLRSTGNHHDWWLVWLRVYAASAQASIQVSDTCQDSDCLHSMYVCVCACTRIGAYVHSSKEASLLIDSACVWPRS
jgi:hypothetical protein